MAEKNCSDFHKQSFCPVRPVDFWIYHFKLFKFSDFLSSWMVVVLIRKVWVEEETGGVSGGLSNCHKQLGMSKTSGWQTDKQTVAIQKRIWNLTVTLCMEGKRHLCDIWNIQKMKHTEEGLNQSAKSLYAVSEGIKSRYWEKSHLCDCWGRICTLCTWL